MAQPENYRRTSLVKWFNKIQAQSNPPAIGRCAIVVWFFAPFVADGVEVRRLGLFGLLRFRHVLAYRDCCCRINIIIPGRVGAIH